MKTAQVARETEIYPRLMTLGLSNVSRDRPLIKPAPIMLRRFSNSVYARRAINTIKNPIASLHWEIVPKEGIKENREIKRQIKVVTECLARPNNDDSFRSFVEQVVNDLLICGGGAFEHATGADLLRPLWLWPVDALSIQVVPGWTGEPDRPRYFQQLGYANVGGAVGRPLLNDELCYVRLDPTTDSPFGVGPLEIAFNTIARLLGVAEYAGNVTANATPENMLFFKGLSPDHLQAVRAYWRNDVEGQGQAPIFGGDAEPNAFKLRGANDDALYLKYVELLIREIAAAFGISPQNLSIERDVNRDTAEVAEDRDWNGSIIPTATLVSSYLNREVIEGRLGFSQIEFRWKGLDRDDELAAAKIFEIRYRSNVVTPDEERTRLGLTPAEHKWGAASYADVQIATKGAAEPEPKEPEPKPARKGR